ncbi:MAG: Arm DNA-binding domain-containing protein [Christensenellales bacterium]|nr:Arm DNA-binding domain-containing protein [Christensenellales bacterium]
MAVYKEEKTGTWRAVYRYTDWNGERKQTQKRGFKTKREAQAWEREQVHKTSADLDMNFKSFVELYTADMKTRLKENTWATKEHIIRTKLLPYFGKLKMCNITAQQIITWQNEMMNHKDENGQPYSPVYCRIYNPPEKGGYKGQSHISALAQHLLAMLKFALEAETNRNPLFS